MAVPMRDRIAKVNALYDDGHIITIDTARGAETGVDWRDLTKQQLEHWGVKYHALRVGKKPHANYYIDDKAINADEFFKTQ